MCMVVEINEWYVGRNWSNALVVGNRVKNKTGFLSLLMNEGNSRIFKLVFVLLNRSSSKRRMEVYW